MVALLDLKLNLLAGFCKPGPTAVSCIGCKVSACKPNQQPQETTHINAAEHDITSQVGEMLNFTVSGLLTEQSPEVQPVNRTGLTCV